MTRRFKKFVAAVRPADLLAANQAVAAVGGNFGNDEEDFFYQAVIQIEDLDDRDARLWIGYCRVDQDEKRVLKAALKDNPAIPSLQYEEIPEALPVKQTILQWLDDRGFRLKP